MGQPRVNELISLDLWIGGMIAIVVVGCSWCCSRAVGAVVGTARCGGIGVDWVEDGCHYSIGVC